MQIKNLSVSYPDKTVFDGFDLQVEEGKINVIMGVSGVGKTTLLNAIAGVIPYCGEIENKPERVSYIFQNDRLIDAISVYKNLDLILRAFVNDKNERKKRVENMLETLEISSLKNKLPTNLSGGERQRVALARAFLFESDVLLMDEPFKALDVALKSRIISLLIKLHSMDKRTIIFVTHAIDECLMTADVCHVLCGSPASVQKSFEIPYKHEERKLANENLNPFRLELIRTLYGE